jgi:3'-phosphoadenosine 5'-phosphosulfate sulfotransferase (PAPS reductase)/FAD synthetase
VKTIIVPVSGGKDSQVVLSLALKTGRPIVCVHQNTGFDHPDTYAHIVAMEKFYGVTVEHTVSKYPNGMFGYLEHAKYFPNSSARGCTEKLKQRPFAEWLSRNEFYKDNCEIWFGMRSDESAVRANKYGDITMDDTFTLGDVASFYGTGKIKNLGLIDCKLPIVAWSTENVFRYLEAEQAPINPLYARGHIRVGCYPCLLARKAEWQAAGKDSAGRVHIQKMIDLEDKWKAEGNHRKFIKVHRVWDARDFLEGKEVRELANEECGYCSI